MAKNNGKSSEAEFERLVAARGKRAYLHRILDAAGVYGRTGRAAPIPAQPADYLAVLDGNTHFAEVKSTVHPTCFPFSLLRKTQSVAALKVLAAGGGYFVYAKSLAHDRWFRFPYGLVTQTRKAGRASIPWTELEPYAWT